jgi:hypothetical protein
LRLEVVPAYMLLRSSTAISRTDGGKKVEAEKA